MKKLLVVFLLLGSILPSVEAGVSPEGIPRNPRPRNVFPEGRPRPRKPRCKVDGQIVVKADGRQEDPQLVSDNNGGAYIIWKDYRYEPDDGDFFAQHILSDGSLAWDPLGVPLTTVSGKQTSPNLCVDGQGGAFAIWKDESEGGGFSNEEEHKKYVDYLGNRTLLNPGSNASLKNISFRQKQAHEDHGFDLQARQWKVTEDLQSSKISVWGPSEITSRSKQLISKMVEIYDEDFMS